MTSCSIYCSLESGSLFTLIHAAHGVCALHAPNQTRANPLDMAPIYGAVYKAKCDYLPCTAKVLHPTILDPRDQGAQNVTERRVQASVSYIAFQEIQIT